MIDILYVGATVGFFALMLAYVRGCDKLGAGTDPASESAQDTVES